MNKKLSILVTAIAISVVAIGAIVFVDMNSEITSIGAQAQQHNNAAEIKPTQSMRVDGWKTYLNAQYGFSMDYPTNATVDPNVIHTTDTELFHTAIYDTDLGIMVKIYNGDLGKAKYIAYFHNMYSNLGDNVKVYEKPIHITRDGVEGYSFSDIAPGALYKTMNFARNGVYYEFTVFNPPNSEQNEKILNKILGSIMFF